MNTTIYHRGNITVRTLKTQSESNWDFKEIHSQISWWDIFLTILTRLVRPPLATYSSLCSNCVTYVTPCHAIGHQLRCFQGFPGSWQFNFKVSRASCWSSKHSLGPTICLNHSNPQKRYTGRFYLRARLANHETLILQNTSFLRDLNSLHGSRVCYKTHVLSVRPQSLADCDKFFVVIHCKNFLTCSKSVSSH